MSEITTRLRESTAAAARQLTAVSETFHGGSSPSHTVRALRELAPMLVEVADAMMAWQNHLDRRSIGAPHD